MQKIVFFDGVCILCSETVEFLRKRDKGKRLRFAPLQGVTAKKMLKSTDKSNSMRYFVDGKIYLKSDAILRVASDLGGIYKAAKVFLVIPKKVRDAVYDIIARHRYKWFGEMEECKIPTKEEKDVFLP